MGKHALSDAILDSMISEESTFCGLRADDVQRLAAHHGDAMVVVRLRTASTDGSAAIRAPKTPTSNAP